MCCNQIFFNWDKSYMKAFCLRINIYALYRWSIYSVSGYHITQWHLNCKPCMNVCVQYVFKTNTFISFYSFRCMSDILWIMSLLKIHLIHYLYNFNKSPAGKMLTTFFMNSLITFNFFRDDALCRSWKSCPTRGIFCKISWVRKLVSIFIYGQN